MNDEPNHRPVQLESEPRRHLTILFTDLSDSTRLSGLMEAEVYAELQDDVRQAFKAVVAEHGGTINQFQGDGLQALFGNPHATEHDGRRATEVALGVHERIRGLRAKYAPHGAPDLSVHSGVHAGLILARQGDEMGGRFEIFGPAPGIAKHLSDIAERDEILVSEETLGPGSQFFLTSQRRQVTLKGREEPLAIHRILARTSLRTRFEAHAQRGLVPFIGRRVELQRLEQVLGRVASGRTKLVAISAPAGVGKTRLAEQFLLRAAESKFSIARGYCGSDLSAEPLQPFLQMLRSRFRLSPGTTAAEAAESITRELTDIDQQLLAYRPELLQALSITVDTTGQAEPGPCAPERMIAALSRFFAALACSGPQILFIDDWQWADAATRQVVYGIHDLANLPILVLVATRPFELGDLELSAADVVELGPFTDAEADTTIGEMLPSADPFVVGEIRRHSGGNPLFLEELCHSAAGAGTHAGPDAVRGGSAWLETLIESRVARLPREQGDILSAAAVIGNVVPTWLLESLCGRGGDHPLVRGLAGHDFLFPGENSGTLRFKHGITRDVVYAALGLQKRRAMHRNIATLILGRTESGAEPEACESLAYHCAGAAEFAEAARHAERAGDKAVATSSIDRAKAQYSAALGWLDRLAPTAERYQAWRSIVRRLGMASVFDPSRGELEVLGRAVARAREHGDAAGLAYAEYWLAYVNYALGESRAAVEHCELALQAATGLGDERLESYIRAIHGQALAAAGEYHQALDLLDSAVAVKRERRPGSRPAPDMTYSLACKASILGDLGRFDQAQLFFDAALATLPGQGHEVEGSVLCWRSAVNLWQGRWQAARDDALAAQRIAERVKSLYLFAMSRGLGAYAESKLEPGPRALRGLLDSALWLESRDKNLFVSLNHGWLAEALAADGQRAEARLSAARALRRIRKRDWIGAAMAARAMARLAATGEDWNAAERHLGLAETVAHTRGSAHERACNQLCRAEVALAQGARSVASACLDRACDAFEGMQMDWHLAQALRLRQGF
jgi:class 3 adenylate cyclase/tetratricopeptide (TPR) repeat protein